MGRVHMRLDGSWATCHAVQRACPRIMHLANMTPAQARELPIEFLLPLFEVLDPPTWQDEFGNMRWHEGGDPLAPIHRDHDLPAVMYDGDGLRLWYHHGQQHRASGKPAAIDRTGGQEWWVEDELHREGDLPAIIHGTGEQEWWLHGQRHRDGGLPAVVNPDGTVEYWEHDIRTYPI